MRSSLAILMLAGCAFDVAAVDVTVIDAAAAGDLASLELASVDSSEPVEDAATSCDPRGGNDHCSTDGTSVLGCRADGSGFDIQVCPLGCAGAPPHCRSLEPGGAVDKSDFGSATAAPTITSDVVFNADDGSITGGLTRAAGSGVKSAIYYRQTTQSGSSLKVGIFGFAGLTLAPGATIRARGTSAFALVSSKDVTIAGTIDLQDTCTTTTRSAGAGSGGVMNAPNGGGLGGGGGGAADMNGKSSGGGGGGYGDVGGAGGMSTLPGGSAGSAAGSLAAEPLVLLGGGGGGAGGDGGRGGNGGGALQIAVNGVLQLSGVVQASGCGGAGGGNDSGGGGGAGGTILLEAAKVVLLSGGVIAANGGGGGAGGTNAGGGNGAASAVAATGGDGGNLGGSGGAGGAKGSSAGKTPTSPGNKPAGGGGGAVGRIAIRTMDGTIDDRGAIVSPGIGDLGSGGKPVALVAPAVLE